jgi:hypothetical protein
VCCVFWLVSSKCLGGNSIRAGGVGSSVVGGGVEAHNPNLTLLSFFHLTIYYNVFWLVRTPFRLLMHSYLVALLCATCTAHQQFMFLVMCMHLCAQF